jgi:monoamine oxidase
VGPTQDRIVALAKAVGVGVFDAYDTGNNIYAHGDGRTRYSDTGLLGTAPPDVLLLPDIALLVQQIDEMAAKVDPVAPWTYPDARALDGMTLESWVRAHAINTEGILAMLSVLTEALWGAEPREVSMLYALAYVAAAGNETTKGTLERLFDVRNGAQQSRLVGGSQLVAQRVAAALGARVQLSTPVRRIAQTGSGVVVTSDRYVVNAQRVVVAVPPPIAARIDFAPLLPAPHDMLAQRIAMGALMKVEAVYPTPFWRAAGLTGQFVSMQGPVKFAFDNSPPDGSVGVLAGFVGGDSHRGLAPQSLAARRSTVLAQYASVFGDKRFLSPTDYFDMDWTAEQWSRGGPTGLFGPGALTEYGPALREPVGRVHWAGTETADYWQGYMDGAVRSGERAAREVLAAL